MRDAKGHVDIYFIIIIIIIIIIIVAVVAFRLRLCE
jgi:hypothetical protein